MLVQSYNYYYKLARELCKKEIRAASVLSRQLPTDRQWAESRAATLYTQFCDLVVAHYKENRNVNFYARLMDYDPRYFSKMFRQYSNGLSPQEWIQQYVATQAKRIMDTNPGQLVKETAYELGFPDTANFCRYFKRATGIYPQAYKKNGHG